MVTNFETPNIYHNKAQLQIYCKPPQVHPKIIRHNIDHNMEYNTGKFGGNAVIINEVVIGQS